MLIYIGVPTTEYQHFLFTSSLISVITYSMNTLKNVNIVFQPQDGVRTDKNRNLLLKEAYGVNFDYILWLDCDMTYPKDILVKYLEAKKAVDWDIMGCLYYKRKPPYDPVGYLEKGSQKGCYRALHPESIGSKDVMEVMATGYGGMMVSRRVYDGMGEDKWTRYGFNYHLPDTHDEEYQTHDILFCEKAREHGFNVYIHGGVEPKHLSVVEIGYEDWKRYDSVKKYDENVTVIMPTIHAAMAKKTQKILKTRAGMDAKYIIVEDIDKVGYVEVVNREAKNTNSRYIVYLTDDIFPSRNWLKESLDLMKQNNAGLIGYNDGKWKGTLATCGLVDRTWSDRVYNGNIFYPEYFGHYNDTEITLHAFAQKKYFYDPDITLIEIDYQKDQKNVNVQDKKIFNDRKISQFDGKIIDEKILNMFS